MIRIPLCIVHFTVPIHAIVFAVRRFLSGTGTTVSKKKAFEDSRAKTERGHRADDIEAIESVDRE